MVILQIKELEDKVKQIQMLKFGRIVDLEKLETVSVNRVAEELKEKLRDQEMRNAKDIASWDVCSFFVLFSLISCLFYSIVLNTVLLFILIFYLHRKKSMASKQS